MGNTDAINSKLESYFINDLNFSFVLGSKNTFDSVIFSGVVGTIFLTRNTYLMGIIPMMIRGLIPGKPKLWMVQDIIPKLQEIF